MLNVFNGVSGTHVVKHVRFSSDYKSSRQEFVGTGEECRAVAAFYFPRPKEA